MRSPRPHFLNLLQIRLPVGGMVSILHRLSGALLALSLPVLLYVFALSLRSQAGFEQVHALTSGLPGALVGVLLVWAWLHHFLAGLRHLGFDMGLGEAKTRARLTAWGVLVVAIAVSLLATLWWLS